MTNLIETMQPAKFSIDTVVTESKPVKKDIPLPYYFKTDGYSPAFCKVISQDHVIRVDNDKNWWSVGVRLVKHYLSEISKGTEITEEDFEVAYDNALTCVQMMHQDKVSTEPDPNVEIDEILERRTA
jgi:hypothetical protein